MRGLMGLQADYELRRVRCEKQSEIEGMWNQWRHYKLLWLEKAERIRSRVWLVNFNYLRILVVAYES